MKCINKRKRPKNTTPPRYCILGGLKYIIQRDLNLKKIGRYIYYLRGYRKEWKMFNYSKFSRIVRKRSKMSCEDLEFLNDTILGGWKNDTTRKFQRSTR